MPITDPLFPCHCEPEGRGNLSARRGVPSGAPDNAGGFENTPLQIASSPAGSSQRQIKGAPLLGRKVTVVPFNSLRPELRKYVFKDLIYL